MDTQEHPMTDSSVTDLRPEQGEQPLRQLPGEAAKNDSARHPTQVGTGKEDEVSEAPEQESQSQIPGDPRPPHQMQPPTKEQY